MARTCFGLALRLLVPSVRTALALSWARVLLLKAAEHSSPFRLYMQTGADCFCSVLSNGGLMSPDRIVAHKNIVDTYHQNVGYVAEGWNGRLNN